MHADNPYNSTASASADAYRDGGQVSAELMNLEKALESAAMGVTELEGRLSSVVRGQAETVKSPQSQPEPIRVPLADRIMQAHRRVDSITDRLNSIYQRIEL